MSPLTPKQQQVFDYIARHIEKQGFAPSQQEIAKAFGFRSLGTVQNYLVRLEREGLLSRDCTARRGLQLHTARERGLKLQFAGTVAAGKPIEAIEVPSAMSFKSQKACGYKIAKQSRSRTRCMKNCCGCENHLNGGII